MTADDRSRALRTDPDRSSGGSGSGRSRSIPKRTRSGYASRLPVAIGMLLGTVVAMVVTTVLRSVLYGTSPVDPMAFAGAIAVLVVTMAVACIIPPRRAARLDPLVVLRDE